MRALHDKVVVITGGAGGIGSALARAFAQRGSNLALLDLDLDAATRVAEELRASGARATAHQVDVSDRHALVRAHDEVVAEHGGADVLINNAGLTVFSSFERLREDEIDRMLAVNLRGLIDGCRIFLPTLRQRPTAHIINISSSAGCIGMPWQTLYSATKFGVRGFTAALRSELVGEGIGVTCVLPGATATNIIGAASSRDLAVSDHLSGWIKHAYPPARLAKKVVRAVRFNRAELPVTPDGVLCALASRACPRLVRGTLRALVAYARRRELIKTHAEP